MHQILNIDDFKLMKQFIKNDVLNCFYIYMNAEKYGLSSHSVKFYMDNFTKPKIILMNYHDTCQIYSTVIQTDLTSLVETILKINPTIITGNDYIIKQIEPLVKNLYSCSYGYTYEISKFPILKCPFIEIPTDDDLKKCAELICSDTTIGSYYELKSLHNQLVTRRKEGYGRNYIIRINDKIVGHIATYAENSEFASTAGLIVDPKFRDKPYGSYLESYLVNELLTENKRVISFLRENKRVKFYNSLGVGSYNLNGKLVRKVL